MAKGKINLFLDITGQDKKDGYHFIDSLFQEISLYDEIIIKKNKIKKDIIEFENHPELSFNSTIHKTLNLLRGNYPINDFFNISVKKNIPICAGLGGGSSNAATVLSFYAKKYNIPENQTLEIARKIGSDVTFFLYGGLCRVGDKGEKIQKLDLRLKNTFFILIYPNILVKTEMAYSLINNKNPEFNLPDLSNISCLTVDFLTKIVYNRFEKFVLDAFPELRLVYNELKRFLKCNHLFRGGVDLPPKKLIKFKGDLNG